MKLNVHLGRIREGRKEWGVALWWAWVSVCGTCENGDEAHDAERSLAKWPLILPESQWTCVSKLTGHSMCVCAAFTLCGSYMASGKNGKKVVRRTGSLDESRHQWCTSHIAHGGGRKMPQPQHLPLLVFFLVAALLTSGTLQSGRGNQGQSLP